MTEKFYVLIAIVVTWVYAFVKTQTVQVKWVYCIVYKLYSVKFILKISNIGHPELRSTDETQNPFSSVP